MNYEVALPRRCSKHRKSQRLLPQALPPVIASAVVKSRHPDPSEKNKKPAPRTAELRCTAQALWRKHLLDIHNGLFFADIAENHQICGHRGRKDLKDLALPTDGTHEPPFVCLNFTTVLLVNQLFLPPFLRTPRLLYTTPRLIFAYSIDASGSIAMMCWNRP